MKKEFDQKISSTRQKWKVSDELYMQYTHDGLAGGMNQSGSQL